MTRTQVVARSPLPPFGRGIQSPPPLPSPPLAQREAEETEPLPGSGPRGGAAGGALAPALRGALRAAPDAAAGLDRAAARPRHRDPVHARRAERSPGDEVVGGAGAAPGLLPAARSLSRRRSAARRQSQRGAVLPHQRLPAVGVADLGSQRALLAPPAARAARVLLDGAALGTGAGGGLGGGGLLHGLRLLSLAPLLLQPDRRGDPGAGAGRGLPGVRKRSPCGARRRPAAGMVCPGCRSALGAAAAERRPADGGAGGGTGR